MSKKHWIFVKRGLSEDPKHREKMGSAIWVYLHILDRADWETGKVYDWKDEEEANDMCMSPNTLRSWRHKLTELGYIACKQKQYALEITIFNWVNPREYNTGPINLKENLFDDEVQGDTQGDSPVSPSTFQGDTQGDTQVSRKHITPTYDSSSLSPNKEEDTSKKQDFISAFQSAIAGNWNIQEWRKVERALDDPAVTISRVDHTIRVDGLGMQAAMFQDRYARSLSNGLVGVLNENVKVEFTYQEAL